MADLSSLPDPSKPSTTPQQQPAQDASGAVDPINAIGTDPFAAPDTEPQADPFAVGDAVADETVRYVATPDDYDDGVGTGTQPVYAQPSQPLYTPPAEHEFSIYDLPDNMRPLSPWGYVGYAILYAIPVIGLIFLLVHTFSKKNINRRNYARSFWIWLLISIIVIAILTLVGVISPSVYEGLVSHAQGLAQQVSNIIPGN